MREIEKDTAEEEEFFRPTHGLELGPYLALDDIGGIHHLARYHWVKEVLKDLGVGTILDVACGSGYGSYLLADYLPGAQVTGGDYDGRAIEEASSSYQLPNLNYTRADIVSWKDGRGESLGRYDAIVCFDTIEHIAHREIALMRIAESLPDRGVLAFSTPCAHSETQLTPPWTPHKIEYSHRDLKTLLRRFFHVVRAPEENTLPRMSFWEELNRGGDRYLNLANPLLCVYPQRW